MSSTSPGEITASSNHSTPQETELVNWPSERLELWKVQKRRKELKHWGRKIEKCYHLMSNISDCHHIMVS